MLALPEELPTEPLSILRNWLEGARADASIPNPDAMALATVDAAGQPANRVVLCKELAEPGYIVFYTNYESLKARNIEDNARVAGVFHWDHLNRQARFEGVAVRSPDSESDAYFDSRDKESQIGAWTSSQSSPVESRRALMSKHMNTARRLADLQAETGRESIPRPPSWGGYRIWLSAVELWVRGEARLHDRGRWERPLTSADEGFIPGDWQVLRLQP